MKGETMTPERLIQVLRAKCHYLAGMADAMDNKHLTKFVDDTRRILNQFEREYHMSDEELERQQALDGGEDDG
jgi:hypothetical protein